MPLLDTVFKSCLNNDDEAYDEAEAPMKPYLTISTKAWCESETIAPLVDMHASLQWRLIIVAAAITLHAAELSLPFFATFCDSSS